MCRNDRSNGAAAGMAWLVDGRYETISMAISSMIGDVSGMICDGASNSCAMKVSTSASAAWKAVLMALDDTAVTGNEGIVAHDVEQSIANLYCVSKPFDAANGSADYRDYGEQGQINAEVLGIVPDAMLAHLIRPTGCSTC